jgi:hypothetical protein
LYRPHTRSHRKISLYLEYYNKRGKDGQSLQVRVRYAVRKRWVGGGNGNYNSLNRSGKDSIIKMGIQITYVLHRGHFEAAEIVDVYMRLGHVYQPRWLCQWVIGIFVAVMRMRAGVNVNADGR